MNKLLKKILLFFLSTLYALAFSQKLIVFNPIPDFYLLHPGIVNSSTYSDSLYANLNYKSRLGAYQDVRDLYFDVCVPLQENQRAGIKVYSEQETSLFTKNKFELFYSYTITINKKIHWTLAGQGGFAQINFEGTGANAGGNDIAADLAVSSNIQYKSYCFSYAYNQLTRSNIQPLSYTFVLHPYHQIAFVKSLTNNPSTSLNFGGNAYFSHAFFLWELLGEMKYNQLGVLVKLGNNNHYALGGYLFLTIGESYSSKIGMSYSNAYYPGVIGSNTLSVFLQIISL